MDFKIKNISVKWRGKPVIKDLQREALKTKINPSLEDRTTKVNMIRKREEYSGKMNTLSIHYGSTIEALEAYKHVADYGVLARDLAGGENPFLTLGINVIPAFYDSSMMMKKEWGIDRSSRAKDKGLLLIGVEGDSKRDKGEAFDDIWSNPNYRESPLKYGDQKIILNPRFSLGVNIETLSEEFIQQKIKDAEGWLEAYLSFEKSKDEPSSSRLEVTKGFYVVQKLPRKIRDLDIEIPLGEFMGDNLSAFYRLNLRDLNHINS